MKDIVFVTGNAKKAEYFSKCIDLPVQYEAVTLEEIQSLNIQEIAQHKLEQAYEKLHKPVLIEDLSLEFEGLNGLPGTFVKFFLETLPLQDICDLLKGKTRIATVKSVIGYKDGDQTKLFEQVSCGTISETPRGSGGFGWDPIFIPDGYNQTRAEMNEEDDEITFKALKPFGALREFLQRSV